jgi:hypothetical protein
LTTFGQSTVAAVGASIVSGVGLVSGFLSPTDVTNPIVKRYLSELQAARQPSNPLNVTILGVAAWAGMHMLADRLKSMHLAPTQANVLKTLTAKPSVAPLATKWGMSSVNYLVNPYTSLNDPILNTLRLFSRTVYFYRFNGKGIPVPLAKKPQDVLSTKPIAGK